LQAVFLPDLVYFLLEVIHYLPFVRDFEVEVGDFTFDVSVDIIYEVN